MLREVVEEAVRSLKSGKSEGVDNIRSELLKNGGKATTTVLTAMCKEIWKTKEWPKCEHNCLSYLYQKKGNQKQCQNYRTISLISHPSETMHQVIVSRLKAKTEVKACWKKNKQVLDQAKIQYISGTDPQ